MTKTNAKFTNKATTAAQSKALSGVAAVLSYRALEPRVVFDGAGVALVADAMKHQDKVADTHGPAAVADPAHVAIEQQHDALVASLRNAAPTAPHDAPAQIVFIENNLADLTTLLKDVPHDATIVMLESTKDGMDQIAQYLAGRSGIGAIHILSHGAAGEVDLGTGTLTTASLAGRYAADIATIKSALAPNADILLYGCDIAQGSAGHAFVQALATVTGEDVAASTDLTGAASLGGNWVLEDHVGTIHTASISAADWNGELSAAASNGKGALLTVTGNNIYSVDVGTGKASLVTTVPASVGGVAFSGVANSLAVDQADGLIYYTDNNGSPANTALFAYDFVHDKHILITNNVGAYGIVVAPDNGVGLGGATFANNTLYLGIDNPSGTEDAIYAVKFANGGTTITSATHLNTTLPLTNDWGDIGYDPVNNNLLSFSAPDLSVTRINPTTGATVGTGLPMPAGSGYQGSQDVAGNVYAVGTAIQQINPLTGAAIGASITITTDGSTAVGGANDAAGWTPPTATIQGHVYWDNNTNKINDTGDTPIANVTVQLYTDVNNDGVINGQDKLLATDTTDASGQYQFTSALPGDYIVKVTDANGVIGTHTYSTAGGTINPNAHVAIIGSTISNIDFGVADTVTAANDTFATFNNTPVTIKATANDSDPQGDAFTVTAVNGTAFSASTTSIAVTGGSVALDASDNLVFTPDTAYNGSPSFNYTVTDSHGATATATVSGTVSYAPPIAVNDTFTTNANTPIVIDANANDTDIYSFPLTITKIGATAVTAGGAAVAVTDGTVKLNTDGTLTFAPTANYTGTVPSFTYTVSDGHGGTATATVTGTVFAPPVAVANTFATTTDLPITVNVVGNDSDPSGFALSIDSVNGTAITAGGPGVAVTAGTVTMDTAGFLTFTPDAGYNGSSSFTYTIDDGHGGTATTTVSGTVSPLNHPPVNVVPGDQVYTGSTLVLSTANSNAVQVTDDASATAIIQTTVAVDTGTLTLKQTTGLTFLAGDGTADATMTIKGTKAAINAALDGMTYNAPASSTAIGHLTITTNDLGQPNGEDIPNGSFETTLTPVADGALRIMNQSQVPGWTTTAPDSQMEIWGTGFLGVTAYEGHHFAELNANYAAADVAVSTVPKGQSLDFSFAHRGRQGVDVMNVTVIDAGADGIFGTADDATLMNQNYSDGNTAWGAYQKDLGVSSGNPVKLVFTSVSAAGGNPTVGNFLDAVHLGTTHLTDTHTVLLSKLPPPVAVNDTFGTPLNTPVIIDALANDTDANGFPLSITKVNGAAVTSGGTPVAVTDGTVSLNTDGTLTFTPASGYTGNVPAFTYTIADGHRSIVTASVTGTVWAAPIAKNDTFSTAQDLATAISPLANDTDPNTFPLTITQVNGQAISVGGAPVAIDHGTLALTASGQLVYTPTAGYSGPESYTYTVSDGHGGTATATDSGTVYSPPVGTPDTFSTHSGTPAVVAVLTNDTDPNAFPLSVTMVNSTPITTGGTPVAVTGGNVALDATGDLTFTPNAGFIGPVSYTYGISDGHGGTATTTVSGNVYARPTAINDSFTTAQGVPATIPVLANDTDASGLPLTITSVDGTPITAGGTVFVVGGTVTLDPTGNLVFKPNPGYIGTPSFTYGITDGQGGSASALVTGTITPTPPTAVNDAFATTAGAPAVITVLANDIDPNSFPLTVTQVNSSPITAAGASVAVTDSVTGNAAGTVTLDATGKLTFTPNAGYAGVPSFTYTETDGHSPAVTATVTGTVYAAPVAVDDHFLTLANTPIVIKPLANNTDLNSFPLTITQINGTPIAAGGAPVNVSNGTVALDNTGNLTFTPNTGYSGQPSFHYTVSDQHGGTAVAQVNGSVLPPASPFTTPEDITPAPATGVSALPGLTITKVDGSPIDTTHPVTLADGSGVVSLNPTGTLTFTPSTGYAGTPAYTYTAIDPFGNTATATVPGIVTDVPPTPADDHFLTPANTPVVIPVLANDVAVAGNTLTVTKITGSTIDATHPVTLADGSGTVALDPAGTLTFTPSAGYSGQPSFYYTVSDQHGGTAVAQVTGTVWAPPLAQADTFAIAASTPVAIAALANDTDANGFPLAITKINGLPIAAGSAPIAVTGGTVTLDALGKLTYTPAPGYSGTPSFNYTIDDGHSGTATAIVNGTVWAPPVATDDTVKTVAGQTAVIKPLANDTDPNGFPLKVTQINGLPIKAGGSPVAVTGGTVSLDGAGNLTFTPNPGYAGTPSFTYTIDDGHGGSAQAAVSITVNPQTLPNNAPLAPALTDAEALPSPDYVSQSGMVGATVHAITPLENRLWSTSAAGDGLNVGAAWSQTTFTGSSLRVDVNPLGSGSDPGTGFLVQSIVSDGVLSLSLEENRSHAGGRFIVDYRVLQADGRALPPWLERPSTDLVQGKRSADTETIDLSITAIYSDGTDVSENMRVNTLNGTFQSLPRKQSDLGHKLFGKQFDSATMLGQTQREALADMLSWRH